MSKNLKSTIFSAKRQTTTLVVVASLLLLLGGGGMYALQIRQSAADAEVTTKQGEVGTSEEIARRYQSTLDTYNGTMEQLKFVEPSMTEESYVPTLVEQLQRMAVNDHLKMTSVRPGPPTDPPAPAKTDSSNSSDQSNSSSDKKPASPSYRLMPVSIGVEGTYMQVMTFVYHMTKFPKIVMVQGLTLSPRTGPNDTSVGKSPLIGADISLQAYLFDDANTDASQTTADASVSVPGAPDTGNPIAMAAKRVADVTRKDIVLSDVHDRSEGLLDPSTTKIHSIKGGFGSEQSSIR